MVRDLTRKPAFHDVSFSLQRGEILGIAGLLGSGRSELLKAIYGAEPFDSGEIEIAGRIVRKTDPIRMKKFKLAFTPEDRKAEGLIQILSTRANLCLAGLKVVAPKGWLNKKRENQIVNRLVQDLDIQLVNLEYPVASLSGGNQQKVVIGNWLTTHPQIILLDEPTRGVDVQAKQQIFQIMWDLSREGISSIFVSSELEELVQVCHRILIMKKGTIAEQVKPDQLTADALFVRCLEK